MGILDITNRTENWKTASSFAPFFAEAPARRNLANRLLEPLGDPLGNGEVQIELFWYGMRDQQSKEGWENKDAAEKESVAQRCVNLFNDLFPEQIGRAHV